MPLPLVHARTEVRACPHLNQSSAASRPLSPLCLFDALRSPLASHSALSVHPPLRDHPPHPAPGIRHIPGIPGDDVDVQVHHRLAGGFSDVDADVVAVGMEASVEEVFCLADEREEGGLLCVRRVEEGGDVTEGDEEDLPRILV